MGIEIRHVGVLGPVAIYIWVFCGPRLVFFHNTIINGRARTFFVVESKKKNYRKSFKIAKMLLDVQIFS